LTDYPPTGGNSFHVCPSVWYLGLVDLGLLHYVAKKNAGRAQYLAIIAAFFLSPQSLNTLENVAI